MKVKVTWPDDKGGGISTVYDTMEQAMEEVQAMLEIDTGMMQAFVKEPMVMHIEMTREAVTPPRDETTLYGLNPDAPKEREGLKSV